MALTKQQKDDVVARVDGLLSDSKMTVVARYAGLSVKKMQTLRKEAKSQDVVIGVLKNRLVKVSLKNNDKLKDIDADMLKGQLTYAFGMSDEVAPTKVLADFAKENPALELVGGFNSEAEIFSVDQIKQLSSLPSKDALRGQVVGTIAAPLTGFVRVVGGNLNGLVNVLNARKQAIEA